MNKRPDSTGGAGFPTCSVRHTCSFCGQAVAGAGLEDALAAEVVRDHELSECDVAKMRDKFARSALTGLLAGPYVDRARAGGDEVVAYEIADRMMAARYAFLARKK